MNCWGTHTQALRKFRNRCVPRNLYPPDVRSSKEKVSNKLKIGYREAHFSTTYTVGVCSCGACLPSIYAQCCEAVFVFVMAKRQFSYFIINASASQLLRQAGQVNNDLGVLYKGRPLLGGSGGFRVVDENGEGGRGVSQIDVHF